MAIIVNLDVMLARRKVKSKDLAEAVGITVQNISLLKSGKVKGIRFNTLDAICDYLDCQPGDILEYQPDLPDNDAEELELLDAEGGAPTPELSRREQEALPDRSGD